MKSFAKFSIDSGWSWVVCVSSFIVQFAALGIPSSFGTFFVAFLQEFKEGESLTAWVGSIALAFVFFCGPFVLPLIQRLGPRIVVCLGSGLGMMSVLLTSFVQDFSLMFITYGVLMGVACSLCYFGSVSGIVMYFKKHLSVAYGICIAGSGVGTPVLITLLDYLNRRYGWRLTFRGLVMVFGVVFLCGLTFIPRKNSDLTLDGTNDNNSKGETLSVSLSVATKSPWKGRHCIKEFLNKLKFVFCFFFDPSVLKNKAFVVWTVGIALAHFGYFMPFVFLIRLAEDIGVTESKSALLIAYMAFTQVMGKIIFGKIGDLSCVNPVSFLQVSLFLQGVATTLLPLATSYWALVLYVIAFGLCDGCFSIMLAMGTCQTVGQNKMAAAIAHVYGAVSIPSVLGPPLAGLLYDKLGTYNVAFYLAGAFSTLGVSLIFLVPWLISSSSEQLKEDYKKSLIEVKLSSEQSEPDSDNKGDGFYCEMSSNLPDLENAVSLQEKRHLLIEHNVGKTSRPSSFIFLNMFIENLPQQETDFEDSREVPIPDSNCILPANTSENLDYTSPSGSHSLASQHNSNSLLQDTKYDELLIKTRSSSLESTSGKSSIDESLQDSSTSLSSGSVAYDSGLGEEIGANREKTKGWRSAASPGHKSRENLTRKFFGNVKECLDNLENKNIPSSVAEGSLYLSSEPLQKVLGTVDLYSQMMESVLEQEAISERSSTKNVVFTQELRGSPIVSWYRYPYTLSQTELHLSKSDETVV